jgi:deoxyadenosine/deoxycytidine kinase
MHATRSVGPSSFIIEGNIGAGKSTFVSLVKNYLDVHLVYEPHYEWQAVGGKHNILQAFYEDTKRWAYSFQTYAFVTRVRNQQEHARKFPHMTHVLERSVWSDRYCFAKNCHEMGVMNDLEWHLYQEWFTWLMHNYVALPQGFIYLQTDPEVCYQRITKRDRTEEAAVQLSYIQALHEKHERWLVEKDGIEDALKSIPVLVLNVNRDFESDMQMQRECMERVAAFIEQSAGVQVGTHKPFDQMSL